jgi:hypothetical protein
MISALIHDARAAVPLLEALPPVWKFLVALFGNGRLPFRAEGVGYGDQTSRLAAVR